MPAPFYQTWKRAPKNLFSSSITTILMLSLINCGSGSKETRGSAATPPQNPVTVGEIQEQTKSAYADLQVIVKNTSGSLIHQATVQLYDVTDKKVVSVGLSNEAGTYNAQDVDRYADYSIKVAHKDYALQMTNLAISLSPSQLNTFTITLVPIGEKVTFNEDRGGTVSLSTKSRGVKLRVPANAFVDETGTAVEGLVDAEVTTIDMSSAQEKTLFPGSFDAVDADGSNQYLYSYGVTHVDFYQNSKELKVAPNTQVAVEFPVFVTTRPNGGPVKAGDIIPLWWLDEKTGIWVYETNGTVAASTDSPSGWVVKGSVSHFTPYSVDDRHPTIEVNVECLSSTFIGGGFEGASTGDIQTSVPCCVSSKNVTSAFNVEEFNEDHDKFSVGGHGSICSKEHSVTPPHYPVVLQRVASTRNSSDENLAKKNPLCQAVAIKKRLDPDSQAKDEWKAEGLKSEIFHACYSQDIDFSTHTVKANYTFRKAEGENNWEMKHTYTVEPRAMPLYAASAFAPPSDNAVIAQGLATEEELPQSPSIIRDVNLIWEKQFSRPQIPPFRTTSDGRVALLTKTRTNDANEQVFKFYLLAPEKITGNFLASQAGAVILASTQPYTLPRKNFIPITEGGESVHSAICETGSSLPQVCTDNTDNDCYHFDIVTPFYNKQNSAMEIWKTPVNVEITNPKTAQAKIDKITTGTSVRGVAWPNIQSVLETVITDDGRLLVARIANNPLTWKNSRTGKTQTTHPNVIYSYIPKSEDACDVKNFRGPYPITHAHYDNAMQNSYGFATYPIFDSTGLRIRDGADFGGSYAWIDSKGKNLFFSTFKQSIYDSNNIPAFSLACITNAKNCDRLTENLTEDTLGIAVAGLWTKGRTILLDNALNNVDWSLGATPSGHALAKLYQGVNGWAHVGSGRENTSTDNEFLPPGNPGNLNFIDSIESKLNAFPAMRPAVPHDVTWWVSSGKATDIVSFDDWLNPEVLISSDMVQSIEGENLEPNVRHIQNAATTALYNPPQFGEIIGVGRIEPVALGGVHGKGFYSRQGSGIRYTIPTGNNTEINTQNWYIGLFIDPRFTDDNQRRPLIKFPDGSTIALGGLSNIIFSPNANLEKIHLLPNKLFANQYQHLGFRILFGGNIDIFVNGMLVASLQRDTSWNSAFKIQLGELYLGRGFDGWLDEFKVIAQADQMNPESFCNHASGSITGIVDAPLLPSGKTISDHFIDGYLPLNKQYNAYLCYTGNRSSDGWVNLTALPTDVVSLRQDLLFPEGPLNANQPRPDSSNNLFCVSCHESDGRNIHPLTLTAQALTPNGIIEKLDLRRQPSQPPYKIYGNVPSGLFGPNNPLTNLPNTTNGILVDDYILGIE